MEQDMDIKTQDGVDDIGTDVLIDGTFRDVEAATFKVNPRI